jgi:hypothetical protein
VFYVSGTPLLLLWVNVFVHTTSVSSGLLTIMQWESNKIRLKMVLVPLRKWKSAPVCSRRCVVCNSAGVSTVFGLWRLGNMGDVGLAGRDEVERKGNSRESTSVSHRQARRKQYMGAYMQIGRSTQHGPDMWCNLRSDPRTPFKGKCF